jgi:hypothetical protein
MEDQRNAGENSCNSGDGTDQRVQTLMFMMMILPYYMVASYVTEKAMFATEVSQVRRS